MEALFPEKRRRSKKKKCCQLMAIQSL
ncbi:hypothetical protein Goklo_001322 [Gossypium klotzschianum]|uniref:Uncharacterized protein n=1 Tax=Gossypium klotzschianum TaxID=34286 RepID=A0A7J8W0L9_9ROSI|nr:hypothetical protein [Gossypium klotzschianum]